VLDKIQNWTYTIENLVLDFRKREGETAVRETVQQQNIELNRVWKRMNQQYHAYAVANDLSDPAMWMLYSLAETGYGKTLTQNDLVEIWMYPKQTVNFTIAALVKKGYVYMEQMGGARNSKAVRLTEEGKTFCKQVIRPLIEAEQRALFTLTDEQRELLLRLSERQCTALETEIGSLIKE